MTQAEHARALVIQALGHLTLTNIELQTQVAALQKLAETARPPDASAPVKDDATDAQ
jgi:hypothetical protein